MDETPPLADMPTSPPLAAVPAPRRNWLRYVAERLALLVGLAVLAVVVLDSPIGHRFIADRIAAYAPASGLKITIGRIDGSIFTRASLQDVRFADRRGVFLRVPEVALDWRPFNWLHSGLDIRELTLRRGRLQRLPKLRPGDPDAPILPQFDVRIDRLAIENLLVEKAVLGEARRIGLLGRVDIRKGRALVRLDGRLGGRDRLYALLDAEPDRDRFDLHVDYAAPRGGLLAGLSGIDQDQRLRIVGKGQWRDWRGSLLAEQGGKRLAAFRLTNRAGDYGVLGQMWPNGLLHGLAQRAAGTVVSVRAGATLADSVLTMQGAISSAALRAEARGGIDLAENAFQRFVVGARVLDPALPGGDLRLEGARLAGTLDGKFRDLAIRHDISAASARSGTIRLDNLATRGTARYDGKRWVLPLDLTMGRIVTGQADIDPRLVNLRVQGPVTIAASALTAQALAITLPGISARPSIRGDLARGTFALAGPVTVRGWPLADIGSASVDGNVTLDLGARQAGGSLPWNIRASLSGRLAQVSNDTLASLAGGDIRFAGTIAAGHEQGLLVERASLDSPKLKMALTGKRLANGAMALAGRGSHGDYGPFVIDASLAADGPRAVLVLDDPLPVARLRQVRLALSPAGDGFRIEVDGASPLGPFAGSLGLIARTGQPTQLVVERLNVANTGITGALSLTRAGVLGELRIAGGGVTGALRLAPKDDAQRVDVALVAQDARFGGNKPLIIGNGLLEAGGLLRKGGSTFNINLFGQGIGKGNLFLGRLAAHATLNGGNGSFSAALAGRRGSRFALDVQGDLAPQRISLLAKGDFAGQRIIMPRRAVLTDEADGWRLAPTQVNFSNGRLIGSGLFGGRSTELDLGLAGMPLGAADILVNDLGLGGTVSGVVTYRHHHEGSPTGNVQLQVRGLTRSGLVLTSRPVDVALVGALGGQALETRAVVREGKFVRGRIQARISGLPAQGTLAERLFAGQLFGQMRYDGPADALWRLVALEEFDLNGPVALAADIHGTLDNPMIRGSLASDALRLQSALTGTDLSAISVRGQFGGSRLDISRLSGRAANGGQVSGSGSIDFNGIGEHAPALDLRLVARNAQILARTDMAAAVTGPLRILSDGNGGTIAGRLTIDTARWQLGRAAAVEQLPNIATRELNRRVDVAPPRGRGLPWRFLIDAAGGNRVDVRGLGLDSEWGADIRIRGTTDAPNIQGRADLVRGGYDFAGQRFELKRGRISFDGNSPPNPRLDIIADANVTGLTARVTVYGTSLRPEITFSSTPALPEEELLSRLLFGSSITQISAPEALQLGAALAALRSGGGLDPINKLRSAIGLDRLRIVSADASLGRSTGVAVGKYMGRRFYAEVITDGRGYSATQLEFRVTNWLSLLGSVSTIGRESVNARISRDY